MNDDMHRLASKLRGAGHRAHVDGEILLVRGIDGREYRIIHHAEQTTFDTFNVDGAVVGEYTVPAGWRAVDDGGRTLCEGASLEELRAKLREKLGEKKAEPSSPFDPPFGNRASDELSTEHVFDIENVSTVDRRLIGQTGESDEPTRTGYMARTAHYARWGDVPGQLTGWAGPWPTRAAAEKALRAHQDRTKTDNHHHQQRGAAREE